MDDICVTQVKETTKSMDTDYGINSEDMVFSQESFNLYSEIFIIVDDLKENKLDFERI